MDIGLKKTWLGSADIVFKQMKKLFLLSGNNLVQAIPKIEARKACMWLKSNVLIRRLQFGFLDYYWKANTQIL